MGISYMIKHDTCLWWMHCTTSDISFFFLVFLIMQEYARNLRAIGIDAREIETFRALWQCVAPRDKQDNIQFWCKDQFEYIEENCLRSLNIRRYVSCCSFRMDVGMIFIHRALDFDCCHCFILDGLLRIIQGSRVHPKFEKCIKPHVVGNTPILLKDCFSVLVSNLFLVHAYLKRTSIPLFFLLGPCSYHRLFEWLRVHIGSLLLKWIR